MIDLHRLNTVSLVLALGCASIGCDGAEEPTVEERFCEAAAASADADDPLLADCASLAGLLNDGYLEAATVCVEGGGETVGCLRQEVGALSPSPAHTELASAFCSECALGVSGCEDVFFAGGEDDAARAGAVIVPLSDDVTAQIQAECTSGLTCAATFVSCAQGQIAAAGLPTETVEALIQNVFLGGGDAGGEDDE